MAEKKDPAPALRAVLRHLDLARKAIADEEQIEALTEIDTLLDVTVTECKRTQAAVTRKK